MSDGYADLLRRLLPDAVVDICYPADPGANLPIGGLEGYDGVAITGSALNVYDGGPSIDPQIELAREVLKSKTPLFGSCWGLQVITVAAGGVVRPNPKGREIGIGRQIALTPAGRDHPMYAGKASVFDAVTVHLDEVEILAPGTTVLAANAQSDVQAAEIRRRRRGRLGRAVSSGVLARRHGGDHAALRTAADARGLLRRRGRRATPMWRISTRSTASRTTSRSPGATASTRACSIWRVRTTEIANWIDASGAADASRRGGR